ncbi:MAG: hypothetical protein ACK4FA_02045 [Candidatus Paceibacteria bacterium]
MAKGFEKGFDPGKRGPGEKRSNGHDTGGVKVNPDGTFEVKTRKMPCGVEVPDTEEAEYAHRSSCDKCTTLF